MHPHDSSGLGGYTKLQNHQSGGYESRALLASCSKRTLKDACRSVFHKKIHRPSTYIVSTLISHFNENCLELSVHCSIAAVQAFLHLKIHSSCLRPLLPQRDGIQLGMDCPEKSGFSSWMRLFRTAVSWVTSPRCLENGKMKLRSIFSPASG